LELELGEVIARRRAVRAFDPNRPVADEVLDQMLDLARRAPSAGFSQGVDFVVLRAPEGTATFWDVTGGRGWWAGRAPGVLAAPVVVLPLADPRAYLARYAEPDKAGHGLEREAGWPVPYWQIDAAFATMQLQLLATAAGLGTLFFGIFRGESALMDALGVPEGVRPIGAVALGHPAADDAPSGSSRRRARRPLDEVVHRDRW
jgi:nitroreductase